MSRAVYIVDPTDRYDYREAYVEGGTGEPQDPLRLAYPPAVTQTDPDTLTSTCTCGDALRPWIETRFYISRTGRTHYFDGRPCDAPPPATINIGDHAHIHGVPCAWCAPLDEAETPHRGDNVPPQP